MGGRSRGGDAGRRGRLRQRADRDEPRHAGHGDVGPGRARAAPHGRARAGRPDAAHGRTQRRLRVRRGRRRWRVHRPLVGRHRLVSRRDRAARSPLRERRLGRHAQRFARARGPRRGPLPHLRVELSAGRDGRLRAQDPADAARLRDDHRGRDACSRWDWRSGHRGRANRQRSARHRRHAAQLGRALRHLYVRLRRWQHRANPTLFVGVRSVLDRASAVRGAGRQRRPDPPGSHRGARLRRHADRPAPHPRDELSRGRVRCVHARGHRRCGRSRGRHGDPAPRWRQHDADGPHVPHRAGHARARRPHAARGGVLRRRDRHAACGRDGEPAASLDRVRHLPARALALGSSRGQRRRGAGLDRLRADAPDDRGRRLSRPDDELPRRHGRGVRARHRRARGLHAAAWRHHHAAALGRDSADARRGDAADPRHPRARRPDAPFG